MDSPYKPSKLGELSLFTPNLPAFFVINTHLAVSRQELRKAVREVNSPPPQLEDPDWALDPRLEEDPDIFVEPIDRTFYQLSCNDAMVAITADYPGLLPASHVRKTGVPTSEKDPLLCTSPTVHIWCFTGKAFGTPCRTRSDSQQGTPNPGRPKRKAVRTETPAKRYDTEPRSVVVVLLKI